MSQTHALCQYIVNILLIAHVMFDLETNFDAGVGLSVFVES